MLHNVILLVKYNFLDYNARTFENNYQWDNKHEKILKFFCEPLYYLIRYLHVLVTLIYVLKDKGLWLADVFNVLYRGCDMIMPEKQIGTIKVSDDQNDHYLYKVVDADMTKSSLQQIDEQLMLNGPEISSISAEDSLKIDVDLFCGAFKDTLYIDDCPSDDSIETDSPLEIKIVSEYGK